MAAKEKKEANVFDSSGSELKSASISNSDAALKASMERLSSSINSLVELLKTAEKGIKTEASLEDKTISEKIDILVSHNEEIARALLLLLELNREHLPKISRHTKISSDSAEKQGMLQRTPQRSPEPNPSFSPKMGIPEIELPPLDLESPPASASAPRLKEKKFFGFGK